MLYSKWWSPWMDATLVTGARKFVAKMKRKQINKKAVRKYTQVT